MKEIEVFTDNNELSEELTEAEKEKAKKLFPYGVWKEGEELCIKPHRENGEIRLKSKEEINAFIEVVKATSSL